MTKGVDVTSPVTKGDIPLFEGNHAPLVREVSAKADGRSQQWKGWEKPNVIAIPA